MNILKHIIILLTAFTAITSYAQKVSNISFRQEQSTIIVSYDLETKTPCKVSLYVSIDGGVKWQGPLIKVTGDVGVKIVSGSHIITWKVLEEFEELKGNNVKFQVKAIGSDIETVMIGDQEWTTKNLNVSKYRNGDIIPEVKDQNEWDELTTGAWCYYNNDPKNGEIYGKLYNWYAVNDSRGLAPTGYHIPTVAEYNILQTELGGLTSGGPLKEAGFAHWIAPNTGATNTSGWTGLPGGQRNYNSTFQYIQEGAAFWTSSIGDVSGVGLWTPIANKSISNDQLGFFCPITRFDTVTD